MNNMHDKLVEYIEDALNNYPHYCAKERQKASETESETEFTEIYENILSLPEFIAKTLLSQGVKLN